MPMTAEKLSTDLVERTRRLLHERPRPLTYAEIGRRCDVTIPWLWAFQNSRMEDPGAAKIQRVYEFLSGKKLFR